MKTSQVEERSDRFSLHDKHFVAAVAATLAAQKQNSDDVVKNKKEVTEGVERVLFPVLLCAAAGAGEVIQLQQLVMSGANVNMHDYDRRTPLHLSASEGKLEACKYLIEQNAEINAVDRWGNTPLADALREKHDQVARYLYQIGGRTDRYNSELLFSSADGRLEDVKRYVETGVNVNMKDYDRRTPLHVASAEGRFEVVKYLLSKGADRDALDRWNNTPYDDAILHGFHDVARVFLPNKIDFDTF